ncbi:substrate-binding periplasmic protein [Pseudodesulfovibrio methanolicus]|uniref:Transporter substrate-binding domain-containing protein n=1 Tax=Pseudodesulfovibrio methanolicus TaxID=3126690 RepID=A0ABZ2ITG2_9BACT
MIFGRAGRWLSGLCLAAVLLVTLVPASFAADPLRVVYPDYWPFFTRTVEGRMTGFFYEIVSEALGRMGIRSTWRAYPWSRCQALVRSGDADAMITVATAERLAYAATHEDPFYLKRLKVFTTVDNPRLAEIRNIRSIDDIDRLGLVVVTYHGNGWNDKFIRSRGIKTYESPLLKNVWLMLANRRGDIAIEWPMAAWPLIEEGGVANRIVETDVSLEAMPFHLLINRDCPYAERLPEFNEVIKQMKAEGQIEAIVGKYVTKQ